MATDPAVLMTERYARFLMAAGPLLVAAALLTDTRWTQSLVALAVVTLAVTLLRAGPVRLSKFSYLTQTGVPALVAALVAPPSVGVIGLVVGVLAADVAWLRKPLPAGAGNAGREALSFAVAYGY